MTSRRLGWIRRPTTLPAAQARRYSAARAVPLPEAFDLRSSVVEVLDQGVLGACVAHSHFQAIRMRQVQVGVDRPVLGSRLFGYYVARELDGTTDRDVGTNGDSLLTALARVGYPPEASWPYLPLDTGSAADAFRTKPSPEAYRLAYDQRTITRRQITETGALPRVEAIKAAVFDGHAVTFGCGVDRSFVEETFDASQPLSPPAHSEGGHSMLFVGWTGDNLLVLNSWGPGFGSGGYCLFSPEYVEICDDLEVIEDAPYEVAE